MRSQRWSLRAWTSEWHGLSDGAQAPCARRTCVCVCVCVRRGREVEIECLDSRWSAGAEGLYPLMWSQAVRAPRDKHTHTHTHTTTAEKLLTTEQLPAWPELCHHTHTHTLTLSLLSLHGQLQARARTHTHTHRATTEKLLSTTAEQLLASLEPCQQAEMAAKFREFMEGFGGFIKVCVCVCVCARACFTTIVCVCVCVHVSPPSSSMHTNRTEEQNRTQKASRAARTLMKPPKPSMDSRNTEHNTHTHTHTAPQPDTRPLWSACAPPHTQYSCIMYHIGIHSIYAGMHC